ncbi:hypothetical protein BST81_16035 [Leptolyngbya sp. 'hensonii']|uniref:DUF3288 family protein n=1 Tax=Leptolyngbya sp. 'hensonii' TaxID=1922337 RepID=UPI00094FB9ED|nr:DUF3288 family protein [Leptolyngbya sp. 'hensonii']OLP17316.1 hypothetical protein BST81_16035 [Leptolyngbya sp. 'hensonii']
MATDSEGKDQQHPLWSRDRQVVDSLLQGEPTDYNLVELGRLRIRYQDFPGARDIQRDLDNVLQRWQLTEAELYARTREIHALGEVYRGLGGQRDDWN